MPPRTFALPAASTASAKAARAAFFCELCQKGYARMNEYEAHEGSYDHQHKKRLKEMKELQQSVKNTTTLGKKEEKGPLMKIQLGGKKDTAGEGKGQGSGFKKGGFKNAFAPVGGDGDQEREKEKEVRVKDARGVGVEEEDSDVTDDEYEYYDPRKPTGCASGCPAMSAR